jgi:hypothetical protein
MTVFVHARGKKLSTRRRTVGPDQQKCKETSSSIADKQQKMGENVENIKFSRVSKLNFMFSTFSPIFCCLSNRGPDIRKVGKHYIVILVKS